MNQDLGMFAKLASMTCPLSLRQRVELQLWEQSVVELCEVIGDERGKAIADDIQKRAPAESQMLSNAEWAIEEIKKVRRKAMKGETV